MKKEIKNTLDSLYSLEDLCDDGDFTKEELMLYYDRWGDMRDAVASKTTEDFLLKNGVKLDSFEVLKKF